MARESMQLPHEFGSVVDIIAPGFSPSLQQMQAALEFCGQIQLKPRVPRDLIGDDILCSNSDETRWRHLREALEAKDSKIIWCVRGGYGSVRLLEELESWWKKNRTKAKPKILWGLSDVTSFHLFWNGVMKWPSIHGPLLNMLNHSNFTSMESEVSALLYGDLNNISFTSLQHLNPRHGKAKFLLKAPVTGGNLAVFTSHVGTRFAARSKGHILFFEDIGERAYRIDRLLMQLTLAKVFDNAKAVIFGSFKECVEPDGKVIWPQIIQRWAESVNIPVFTGLPSGHEIPCRSLAFGVTSELSVSHGSATLVQKLRPGSRAR